MSNGLVHNTVNAIIIDSEGIKWFGTNGGVSKFDDNTWTTYDSSNGLVNNRVIDIAIDSEVNKWFGTIRGISKFDDNVWTTYDTSDGLVNNRINSIAIDSVGNIWFGTDGGVSMLVDSSTGIHEETPSNLIKPNNFIGYYNQGNISIRYTIPYSTSVKLEAYDIKGKLVKVITDRFMQKGSYSVNWDNKCFGSGVYFIKLSINSSAVSKKFTIIK